MSISFDMDYIYTLVPICTFKCWVPYLCTGEDALVIVKIFCRVFYMYSFQTFMVFQILFSSLSKHAEIRQLKKPADFYIYVQLQIVISLFAATTPFFYHLEDLNLLKTTLKIEKLLIFWLMIKRAIKEPIMRSTLNSETLKLHRRSTKVSVCLHHQLESVKLSTS